MDYFIAYDVLIKPNCKTLFEQFVSNLDRFFYRVTLTVALQEKKTSSMCSNSSVNQYMKISVNFYYRMSRHDIDKYQ